MAFLHSILQSIFGLGSSKSKSKGETDWFKLALAVAAQPEDDQSKRAVRNALQSNNQEFLDYLRSALDTRSTAASRVAEINRDGIECRAFLPGSPALWGWTTNAAAEATVLQDGMHEAMEASVYDSPLVTSDAMDEDLPLGIGSPDTMGGATLRDLYAKAWEHYREPLVWTPRGPAPGVNESTWILTPMSLVMPSAQTRARRASDASEARSSIIGVSPCLHIQRNQVRRDSVHELFTKSDTKQNGLGSPFVEANATTPSPPLSIEALPPLEFDSPSSAPRRSASCTRSHVSYTTAATVSECSTAQELPGLGLGLSFGASTYSQPGTPSDLSFGDNEAEGDMISNGRKFPYHRGRHTRVSSGPICRRNLAAEEPIRHSKQPKLQRPGVTPLQRVQASLPKRPGRTELGQMAPKSRALRNNSPINRIVSETSKVALNSRDRFTPLRRVQSVAIIALSPSPQFPRSTTPKVPMLGPVPVARRAMNKNLVNGSTVRNRLNELGQPVDTASSHQSSLASAPTTPWQSSSLRPRTPSITQSRIPRPTSRASLRSVHPIEFYKAITPGSESVQVPTAASVTCKDAHPSEFSKTSTPGTPGRARSRTGSSVQAHPRVGKEGRGSRPPSRAQLEIARRSTRSGSVASTVTMADRWTSAEESFSTPAFA